MRVEDAFYFDLAIIGAGPAGCAAALELRASGLRIALIDKSVFPRDKVCGDAIPGRAIQLLKKSSPALFEKLQQFPHKRVIKGAAGIAPNGGQLVVDFSGFGYVMKRLHFDHLLLQEVRQQKNIHCILGQAVKKVSIQTDGAYIKLANNKSIRAQLVMGCDGANSVVARQLTNRKVDPGHHCGAVRTYFQNVQMIKPDQMKIFLLDGFLPGYFWIFPLDENLCNVGFGMLTRDISHHRLHLRSALEELLLRHPVLQPYFQNAKQLSSIKGFGLPLGSRKVILCGERFLLAGDAASLIDPSTGEGIGNAVLSGQLAAKQVLRSFQAQNFSAPFLHSYQETVYKKLWWEMRTKYYTQRLAKDRAWLINLAVNGANSWPWLKGVIAKQF